MADLVQTLTRLIQHRTQNPGGDEPEMAQLLAGMLVERRADSAKVRGVAREDSTGAYVLARWGKPRLLVNVHFDTVPPNAGWTASPYEARVVTVDGEQRLIGLGAADIKGAIAAILCALDEVQPRDTAILFSGDEELNNTCMRQFILDEPQLIAGLERAIVCEPTSMQVGVRHRGILSFEVELRGKGGHSSRADVLPRPIAELARLAVAYDDWGRARLDAGPAGFKGMCLNLAKLEGGVAFNVVPERAILTVCLRPPPGDDVTALRDELAAIARAAVPGAELRFLIDSPPFATRGLSRFAALVGERAARPIDLAFWTEAALLSTAGVDAIVIGPGHINHAHAPDEWVGLAELEAARQMFVQVFKETVDGAS